MWIMTNRGFYSIVEKEWDKADGTLTVRSRRLADLENFLDGVVNPLRVKDARPGQYLEIGKSEKWGDQIEIDPRADYRYRARVDRAAAQEAIARFLFDIDYDNFKNSVSARGLHDHAAAYGSVWSAMMRIQEGGLYNRGELGGHTVDLFAQPDDDIPDCMVEHYECPDCGGTGEVESKNGIDPPEWVECRSCQTPPHIAFPEHFDNDAL